MEMHLSILFHSTNLLPKFNFLSFFHGVNRLSKFISRQFSILHPYDLHHYVCLLVHFLTHTVQATTSATSSRKKLSNISFSNYSILHPHSFYHSICLLIMYTASGSPTYIFRISFGLSRSSVSLNSKLIKKEMDMNGSICVCKIQYITKWSLNLSLEVCMFLC